MKTLAQRTQQLPGPSQRATSTHKSHHGTEANSQFQFLDVLVKMKPNGNFGHTEENAHGPISTCALISP